MTRDQARNTWDLASNCGLLRYSPRDMPIIVTEGAGRRLPYPTPSSDDGRVRYIGPRLRFLARFLALDRPRWPAF